MSGDQESTQPSQADEEPASKGPIIENPKRIQLPPDGEKILKTMFATYGKVIVEKELGGGFSGSRVFQVRPIRKDEIAELSEVVKLAPRYLIQQEEQRYRECIENLVPKVAGVKSEPALPDSHWGGLRYPLGGGDNKKFKIMSLAEYCRQASSEKIIFTIRDRLFGSLDSFWRACDHKSAFSLQNSYDRALPVNLIIDTTKSVIDQTPHLLNPDTVNLNTLSRDDYVHLEGFVVTEVDRKNQTVTLDLRSEATGLPATRRLRLRPVENIEQYRENQVINPTKGQVTATRADILRTEAEDALSSKIDLTKKDIVLSGEYGEHALPNPLMTWSDILNELPSVRVGCIHGDLNLENVLVDHDTGDIQLIDFGRSCRDHVLHDFLCLEMNVIIRLLPEIIDNNTGLSVDIIYELYIKVHLSVCDPSESIDPRLPPVPNLRKVWDILMTIRTGIPKGCFYDDNDWTEYYQGLTLYLLGALRFRSLEENQTAKQLAFWGAATAQELLNLIKKNTDKEIILEKLKKQYIISNKRIASITKNYLDQGGQQDDRENLHHQLARYLKWVLDNHSHIQLRGIERAGQQVVELELKQIYVPLAANIHPNGRQAQVNFDQVLQLGPRIVITGGPGSGKTTILLYLAWLLAKAINDDDPTLVKQKLGLTAPLPLPIFIPLSAYASYLQTKPQDTTLAAFIAHYFVQIESSFDLPTDFFQRLLRDGQQVILLLDGLDEIPAEQDRVRVHRMIEYLVTGRDNIRIIVTCRTAAYRGRTALGKGFQEAKIRPLNDEQVAALVQQAYTALYADNEAKCQKKTSELLQAIKQLEINRRRFVPQTNSLIDSPLLVRMLLIIHYSEHRLPELRAELYMRATEVMLLPEYGPDEAVADRIGGLIGGSREVHRELVQYLAFKMHQRGEHQGREISEDELRDILREHPLYAPLSKDLIELTRLRGTLLEERLGMYRFIHLAFQEYLTARHLAETIRDEAGLAGIAAFFETEPEPILESWWREPALLVAGYLSINNPHSAQNYLRRLAGIDDQAAQRQPLPPEVQLAAAEVAAAALLEWPNAPSTLGPELAVRLAYFFQTPNLLAQTRPTLRAAAGNTLGHLGDPRPGVTGPGQMEFCYVPAGPFWLGSSEEDEVGASDEQPIHQVDLLYGYWLARYPVTVAQFRAFMKVRNSEPRESLSRDTRNHPVRYVSWRDAMAFCEWLTEEWQSQKLLPPDWQVSLPSEAEWEKAARGGLAAPIKPDLVPLDQISAWQPDLDLPKNEQPQRRYPWGDQTDPFKANYRDTGIGSPSPVGCFPEGCSPYGCEDMCGNVLEWTRSLYWPYPYNRGDGRETEGAEGARVLRGGAFDQHAHFVRCAARDDRDSHLVNDYVGFRVVLLHQPQTVDGV